MDGRGRFMDNVFIERFWRTVKHEEVYLQEYDSAYSLADSLERSFDFYNNGRPHESLNHSTPAQVYWQGCSAA